MEIEFIFFETIQYFANLHRRNMFHGDIKPANIFYRDKVVTSDAGSLLDLGKDLEIDVPRFIVT
jgi:hypothetical protein